MIGKNEVSMLLAVLFGGAQMANADLRLSEVMTNNIGSLLDEDGDSSDWIEIHNSGVEDADLTGLFLSDSPGTPKGWEIPSVSIPGGGYLVVFASGKDRSLATGSLHSDFRLKNGGEFLGLFSADGITLIDSFEPEIPQLDEGQSFGVALVEGKWVKHFYDSPTPGEPNAAGRVAEVVEFSLGGRPFTNPIQVELTSSSGSEIFFTLDGTAPDRGNRTQYTGPVTIRETQILSASIANGPVSQEAYFQIDSAVAEFTSDVPIVVMKASITIGRSFGGMQIGILEPNSLGARTSFDSGFSLSSRGVARTRGSSTQSFPKKSYRVEFQDSAGEDRVLKPLGLPAESDWIIGGRYEEDRSLIRNEVAFELSNQIGRYASQTRFCEVFVHSGSGPVRMSDYVGAYSLVESLKRDADRIDIAELRPEHSGQPEVTGGYILKVDRSGPNDTTITVGRGSGQRVQIVEPDNSSLTNSQQAYIQLFLGRMAGSLGSSDPNTGYPAFIDEGSWVDIHLLNMLMLNVDALRLSSFYHKDRNGKINAGPIWDFNISSGSRDRFGNPPRPSRPDVWRATSGDRGTDFFGSGTQQWWGTLFRQRDFQQAYCDRWNQLRENEFSTANLYAIIDRLADQAREAQGRNQDRWPGVAPQYGGWQGEIDHLKDWLATRVEWVDNELVAPPEVSPSGGSLVDDADVLIQGHRGGRLLYTLTGTDPRLPGGGVSPDAIEYSGSIRLQNSARLVVREYLPNYAPLSNGPDQEWSAPQSTEFVINAIAASVNSLVISEIMYHPADPSEAEGAAGYSNDGFFEFIELANAGDEPIDLLGVRFDDGIKFGFSESFLLLPGGHVVLASNPTAFGFRYGTAINVAGGFSGQLGNSGERLSLVDLDGEPIVTLSYGDSNPWPTEADGSGASIVLASLDSDLNPDLAASWRASAEAGGSPGATDQIEIGLSYAQWVESVFEADQLNVSGPENDPDSDGLVNLLEFVVMGDPLAALRNEGLGLAIARAATQADALTVSYVQRVGIIGVNLVVEASSDLRTWSPLEATTSEPESVNADLERVGITVVAPKSPSIRFFRVNVR